MAKTPETFYKEYNGKRFNKGNGWNDSYFGYQCVAGFKAFCEWMGIPVILTPNNYANGYWTCTNVNGTANANTKAWQTKYFDKVTKNFQDGDWVMWSKGSRSHPSSHIAMYYQGKEFGQNQGGNGAFCLKATDFSDACGALRPKQWVKNMNDLSKYTDEQLADMVLQGKFGNGEDRKKALGSRYSAVQAIIDARYSKKKTNAEIAQEVLDGKWGNGDARKEAITKAGYDYSAVQKIVNELVAKKTTKYAPNLPFTQPNTNSIVNAHRYDFNYANFASYIKKAGGYAAYVRSLGGVFTKWQGRNVTLVPDYQAKTVREFQEACDYVFGLMTLYGFNYNKGKPGTSKNWGYGANDAFYPKTADYDKLGLLVYENGHKTTIDLICAGTTKAGMTTNCGWSVTYCLRKAGLIPADAENVEVEFYGNASYHKYYRNRGGVILEPKNTADLRVGDVIGYFKSGGYAHCAICVAVDKSKGTYTLYDGGSARFIKTRGNNIVGKLGDSPLYGSYTSWKVLRLKEISNLLDLKYDKAKAGAYQVTSDAFKMREGAGTDKKVLCSLAKGTLFTTDGDYLTDSQGRVWLYGTAKSGKVSYRGFCCAKSYLKKV